MIGTILGLMGIACVAAVLTSDDNNHTGNSRPNNQQRPANNPQTTYTTAHNEGTNRARDRASRIPSSKNYRH